MEDIQGQLVSVAVLVAMEAAHEYLQRHGLTADPATLSETLRSWICIKYPEAVRDAREAFAAHMPEAAKATWVASMTLAGVEAAKEAGFPQELLN